MREIDSPPLASTREGCTRRLHNGASEKSAKSKLVPLAGLEPARCCHHLIFSQVSEVSWSFPCVPEDAVALDYRLILWDGDYRGDP